MNVSLIEMAILSIFVVLTIHFPVVFSLFFTSRLQLPGSLNGPETLVFDKYGEGPYTGVSDGRILKYQGSRFGFAGFAYTSANRTNTTCDGSPEVQATCGRPLGLSFHYQTGYLYVADAYKGLLRVDPSGGQATLLTAGVDGVPFRFLDGIDVEQPTGVVFFTEASAMYQLKDIQHLVTTKDATGSLLKYDPSTKQTTVLLRNLSGAAGTAVSKDGSFVLVSEYLANRIQRFWLTGPKANTSEIFIEFTREKPDNIRRNSKGEFWVSVTRVLGLPPPPTPPLLALGYRISEDARVLEVVSFAAAYGAEAASDVHEFNGALYVGSLHVPFGAVFKL